MTRVRVPIAGLMALVVIVALDAAMVRSLIRSDQHVATSPTTSLSIVAFAMGVIPMASLLVFLALMRIPVLLRTAESTSFFLGFQVIGWASVFLFITACALSPPQVARYANTIGSLVGGAIKPVVDHSPEWFLIVLEFGLITTLFSLPELSVAMLGGWLTRKAGISISFHSLGRDRGMTRCKVETQPMVTAREALHS